MRLFDVHFYARVVLARFTKKNATGKLSIFLLTYGIFYYIIRYYVIQCQARSYCYPFKMLNVCRLGTLKRVSAFSIKLVYR